MKNMTPLTNETITITPEMAKRMLEKLEKAKQDGTFAQRALMPTRVARYAEIMASGGWILNGDRLLEDEHGNLMNGQHRLQAVVLSGKPVAFEIRRGIPSEQNGIKTMSTIDSGSNRSVAQRLGFSYSVANPKLITAVATAIGMMVVKSRVYLEVPAVVKLASIFENETEQVLDACAHGHRERRAWFLAPVIFAAKIHPTAALGFARDYTLMEGLSRGNPALELRKFVGNQGCLQGSSSDRINLFRYITLALKAQVENTKLGRIYNTEKGLDWLLDENKALTAKVSSIVRHPILVNPTVAKNH